MGLFGVSEILHFEVPQFVRTLRVGCKDKGARADLGCGWGLGFGVLGALKIYRDGQPLLSSDYGIWP